MVIEGIGVLKYCQLSPPPRRRDFVERCNSKYYGITLAEMIGLELAIVLLTPMHILEIFPPESFLSTTS